MKALLKVLMGVIAGVFFAVTLPHAHGGDVVQKEGICAPLVMPTQVPPPDGCDVSCYWVCPDPCVDVTPVSGGCDLTEGVCYEFSVELPTALCRDCNCGWISGLCSDEGLYRSDYADFTDCY